MHVPGKGGSNVMGFAVPQTKRASLQHSKQRVAGSEHEPVVLSFVSQTILPEELQNRMCVQPALSEDSASEEVASAALSVTVPPDAANTSFELPSDSGLPEPSAQAPRSSTDRTAIAAHVRDTIRVSFSNILMATLPFSLMSKISHTQYHTARAGAMMAQRFIVAGLFCRRDTRSVDLRQ